MEYAMRDLYYTYRPVCAWLLAVCYAAMYAHTPWPFLLGVAMVLSIVGIFDVILWGFDGQARDPRNR